MTNDKLIQLMMQVCGELHHAGQVADYGTAATRRKRDAVVQRAIAKADRVVREYDRRRLGLMRDELNRHVSAKAARAELCSHGLPVKECGADE